MSTINSPIFSKKITKPMFKKSLLVFFTFFSISLTAQSTSDQEDIKKVLFQQQELWNKGNIREFMEYYDKSEDLKFIGKTTIVKGWNATLQRYLTSYPNQETMGKLTFNIIEIDITEGKTAWVLGRWDLNRPKLGDVGGHFTLLMKKINGKWFVLRDHTS